MPRIRFRSLNVNYLIEPNMQFCKSNFNFLLIAYHCRQGKVIALLKPPTNRFK